jgi:cytochrome c oxidase subunit 3
MTRGGKAAAMNRTSAEEAARSGIWVGIAAITMSFAAFTSAIIVREGTDTSWHHMALPGVLYLNTLVLIASSMTLELSRRPVAARISRSQTAGQDGARSGLLWLLVTLGLGLAFLLGQYEAWRQLASQGLFLATNPSSSFFYVLTAVHGVHLLGGLAALGYLAGKLAAAAPRLRRSTVEATSIYWHFMGGLWIYLLLVMRTRL